MSELERRTPLKRTGLKRGPSRERRNLPNGEIEAARKRKAEKRTAIEFSEKTKRRTRNAQGGLCALTGEPIECYHHRLMKSAGGSGTFENCLGLTHEAHRTVHDNVDWARRHGLLIRRFLDPRHVEVFTDCGTDCEIDHAEQ